MISIKRSLFSLTVAASMAVAGAATAEVEDLRIQVIAGDSFSPVYWEQYNKFWHETLPAASEGKFEINGLAWNEVGLKGPEILRLVRRGTYPMGATVLGYNSGDIKELDGLDLALLAPEFDDVLAVHAAYRSTLEKLFEEKYDMKLLTFGPYPPQMVHCREELKSLADLEGRKVRASGTSQAHFVEHFGGTAVNVAFGEMQTALQTGVVDCGITAANAAYVTGWYEAANYIYPLGVTYLNWATLANLEWWNSLNSDTQELIQSEFDKYGEVLVNMMRKELVDGVACLTDGECPQGENGNMTLVEVTQEDIDGRTAALTDTIIPKWATSCSDECVDGWNATIGKLTGFTASK